MKKFPITNVIECENAFYLISDELIYIIKQNSPVSMNLIYLRKSLSKNALIEKIHINFYHGFVGTNLVTEKCVNEVFELIRD